MVPVIPVSEHIRCLRVSIHFSLWRESWSAQRHRLYTVYAAVFSLSRLPQPGSVVFQSQLPRFALRFFLPGSFSPRVELLRLQLSRLHAGKALLVLSAIVPEQGISALPFRPQGNGAHFPAGAAFLIKGPAAIFGVGAARQGNAPCLRTEVCLPG